MKDTSLRLSTSPRTEIGQMRHYNSTESKSYPGIGVVPPNLLVEPPAPLAQGQIEVRFAELPSNKAPPGPSPHRLALAVFAGFGVPGHGHGLGVRGDLPLLPGRQAGRPRHPGVFGDALLGPGGVVHFPGLVAKKHPLDGQLGVPLALVGLHLGVGALRLAAFDGALELAAAVPAVLAGLEPEPVHLRLQLVLADQRERVLAAMRAPVRQLREVAEAQHLPAVGAAHRVGRVLQAHHAVQLSGRRVFHFLHRFHYILL